MDIKFYMIELDKHFMSEYDLGKLGLFEQFDVEGTIWLHVRTNVVQMSLYRTEEVNHLDWPNKSKWY